MILSPTSVGFANKIHAMQSCNLLKSKTTNERLKAME